MLKMWAKVILKTTLIALITGIVIGLLVTRDTLGEVIFGIVLGAFLAVLNVHVKERYGLGKITLYLLILFSCFVLAVPVYFISQYIPSPSWLIFFIAITSFFSTSDTLRTQLKEHKTSL